jgi:hypothetical protein
MQAFEYPPPGVSGAQIEAARPSRFLPAVARLVKVYPMLDGSDFTVPLEPWESPGNLNHSRKATVAPFQCISAGIMAL